MDKYCPTQGGTFTGYKPEVRIKDGEVWSSLSVKWGKKGGVPAPQAFGGVLRTIGLCGYNQAKALGHQFAAHAEAE